MTTAVYVHGMWMPGSEMSYIRRYLAKHHGIEGHLFSYPSVRGTLDENAALLEDYVRQLSTGEALHLVGHSLGGVLLLRMLMLHPQAPIDRAVCIGSPLCGSRAAIDLSRHHWGKSILGKTIADGVTGRPASDWAGSVIERHEVGIIAGTVAAGLGRLVTSFDGPSDGTVAVSETRLAGAKDHVCVATSHSGLVLSKKVAEQVAAFLKRGEFLQLA
jgi:pimeloyl-ACP methyl ester carboxylesterase